MDSKSARQEAVNSLKQNLILDAALKVISRDGYMNAKLEDIAEEAGFSKASLYHYFPDREALILNLVIREQHATLELCQEIVERGLPFIETIREMAFVMCKQITTQAKFAGEMSSNMLTSFATMLNKHHELCKMACQSKDAFTNLFSSIIVKAKKSGVLSTKLDDKALTIFIHSIIQTVIHDVYNSSLNDEKNCDFKKTIDNLLEILSPWVNEPPEFVSAERGVNRV